MKKILALLLAILMVFSVTACSGTKPVTNPENTEGGETQNSESAAETEAPKKTYDGVFKAGYARVDITPDTPILLNTGVEMTNVLDPLYATCVAVYDGKTTALIITVDVKNMGTDFCDNARTRIRAVTGVPIANIMMSATHNHSAPTPGNGSGQACTLWTAKLYNYLSNAAKEAIADLADAEIYTGTGKTTGLAFVRRYIHEDGSFSSIHYRGASTTPVVKYETEADDTVQIIRFVRKDKKDIVMTNWQAHVAHAIGTYPSSITADLVYLVRRVVESGDDDTLVAYYQGASGNINLTVKVPGSGPYGGHYQKVGNALGKIILDTLKTNMTKVEAGTIYTTKKSYTAEARLIDPDVLERANAVVATGAEEGTAEYNAALDKYGMKSKYEVNKSISINKNAGKTYAVPLGAIGFGDISFVSVPYEMFDTNGMEVKDGSPYKMTFVLTCAGGGAGYVPSAIAVPNGGYEVYSTGYKYGTAEEVVGVLLEMLTKLNNKKNK